MTQLYVDSQGQAKKHANESDGRRSDSKIPKPWCGHTRLSEEHPVREILTTKQSNQRKMVVATHQKRGSAKVCDPKIEGPHS